MTIASKSGWLILKDNKLATNCGCCCGVIDGKPRTDPKNEGTWVPSGNWRAASNSVDAIVWTFTPNPGNESGNTWFFFGSASTSNANGNATVAEQQDYGNLCNWYSSKINTPYSSGGAGTFFNKRASRLPPSDAIIHVYSSLSTVLTGPVTVRSAYFWSGEFLQGSTLTATVAAHGSPDGGSVFLASNIGVINGGATFNVPARNFATVNGVATFNGRSDLQFSRAMNVGTVNGNAIFYDNSLNWSAFGIPTNGLVNGLATFNNTSINEGTVNLGAVFNDKSLHWETATVNGGAEFNGSACSRRTRGNCVPPCTRKFVTHPSDDPVCNGTAPNGCLGCGGGITAICGCG